MLRPHLDSKRRRRNLVERRSSPPADEAFQEEVRHLAEEAARVTKLEDQSPPATATQPTSERQNPAPRRNSTPTSRPAPLRRSTRFQWLEALPLDEDDPPPHACFRCWKSGHRSARCPAPKPWFHCFNCGRRRVDAHNCPRCATAYALWEGRPAHEARFGPSATVTRPPQGPEMQATPMEIEGVREQPHQSAAVSPPLSTPLPSTTTGRQDERGPPRSPTPPPPSSATRDTGEPVRFLRRPHELPPVRDSGAEGTTTLPRPFPVLPQVRRRESPAVERFGEEVVAASAPDPPPARVTPVSAPRMAPRTTLIAGSAAPQPNTAAATDNSSASSGMTMPIPSLARLMAAMTPADHEEFRVLVAVAVTMPQSVQEQMYAALFDSIRRAK
ncbi:hypothetical protein QAD02_007663 [Eretmocerus hayati]|uniref:Uncharacterized protein n=1 Tax=Eretmocerus hayati TaxID=131215 RepID=A0ACC2N526_9HYME|nr:hypothetical protein QAD02_007663 [Eretmocerus hayati]